MNKPTLNLDSLIAAMQVYGFGSVPLEAIASENESVLAKVDDYDPLRLAATFAGMLTVPDLQSNCVRLESLVHLSLALGNGKRKPNDKIIGQLFSKLGEGTTGRQEDPAEDVFVSSIATPRGNFRVLEGTWEAAGFYLQRVVNALEKIPAGPAYDQMRESVYALLKLSDLVCERASLVRNQLGNEIPIEKIPPRILSASSSLRRIVRFTEADLLDNGISVSHLAEFGFPAPQRSQLAKETIGHSSLERHPIVHRNGEFFFLLPTATSVAIRRYIIETLASRGLREAFVATLAIEYADLFSETPLLGELSGAPIEFQRTEKGVLSGAMRMADKGRYLHFVFFIDTLEGFEESGMVGSNPEPESLLNDFDTWIDEAYISARKDPQFRDMVTLVIGCGVGRGVVNVTSGKRRENWRIEFASAADLMTLSWIPDFKPLSLWRLLDGQDRLKEMGVELQNVNGLLNMVAWSHSLGGHLVPHGQLPEDFGGDDRATFIMIEQNSLRRVRHESAVLWDPHVVRHVTGDWIRVRRDSEALFDEDRNQPYYVAEERNEGRWPACVYETSSRVWWCALETSKSTSGYWAFERSKMIKTWIARVVPVIEPVLPGLPKGRVRLRTKFEGELGDKEGSGKRKLLTYDEAKAAIKVSLDSDLATVTLTAGSRFEEALFHPENIAERALVARIIEGFALLAGNALSHGEQNALLDTVVVNPSARQSHAFMAQGFRDYVRNSVPRTPVTIDPDDAALMKLGLGWRARNRADGRDIHGKQECTAFLNMIVELLENELCADLQQFDREAVIRFALANHESAINDRNNWTRTAAAVLALHKDREATLQTMAERDGELNAVFLSSRLLVEFAICECPIAGARRPGRLDLSRLMAKILTISHYGGWSDAIRWDAMEPLIRVTALGDIHAKPSFEEEILAPYARVGNDLRVEEGVKNYPNNLEEPEPKETNKSDVPDEFWQALEEEFGAPIDVIRKFLDYIENIGVDDSKAVLKLQRSALLNATLDGFP